MKTYNTLIRLHKQELDRLRREMASLENKKEKFLEAIEALKKQLVREMELAKERPEMGQYFGGFAKAMRAKEDGYREEIRKLEQEMEKLKLQIQDKFSELKTIEIARDQYLAREKERQARQETAMLDEIALQQFVRKESN